MSFNVLVVVDAKVLKQISILLKDSFKGVKVFTAHDGIEALVMVKDVAPNLIILDDRIPRLEGMEVYRHLKSGVATRGLKVLMITALADMETASIIMRSGTDRLLVKPFAPDRFVKEVSQMLNLPVQEGVAKAVAAAAPAGPSPSVLVIDAAKTSSSSQVVRRCAARLGLTMIDPCEPHAAPEVLDRRRPDIAFVELMDDLTESFNVCQTVRRRNVAAVLMGRGLTGTDVLKAVRSGVGHVLIKPLKEDAVENKIAQILIRSGKRLPGSGRQGVEKIDFKGAKTPPERVRMVVDKASEMLALPHAVLKMISLCNDPRSTAEELEKYVKTDPAAATIVLKRANSAASGSTRDITSIRDALVRIGMKDTRNIAFALSVIKVFSKETTTFGFNRFMYWVHSMGVATAAAALAESYGTLKADDAFVIGLLHDVGKIILDDYVNADYQEVIQKAAADHLRVCAVERDTFEMDHALIGARIGANWKLPDIMTEAVRDHHRAAGTGEEAAKPEFAMARLVALANSIVKAMGLGHSGDFFVDDFPAAHWAPALARRSVAQLCGDIRRELLAVIDMLEVGNTADLQAPSRRDDRPVVILRGGLENLLAVFFESHGYPTRLAAWEEIDAVDPNHWIACDGRHAPEAKRADAASGAAFGGRQAFVLSDELEEIPARRVHAVNPARDFFKLGTVLEEVENAGE